MKKNYIKTVTLILVLIFVFSVSTQAEVINITIPAEVEVTDINILLGEIAEIRGLSGDHLQEIEMIDLGDSPGPNNRVILYRDIIVNQLEKYDFTDDNIEINIPQRISVILRTQKLEIDQLIDIIKDKVSEEFDYDRESIIINHLYDYRDIYLPLTDYDIEIDVLNQDQIPGTVTLILKIIINEEIWERRFLPGMEIIITKDVFVANRNIMRGNQLNIDDFSQETKEIDSQYRGQLIQDSDDPLFEEGVIKVSMGKGDLLTSYYIDTDLNKQNTGLSNNNTNTGINQNEIVRWGDVLTASVSIGQLQISVKVKARETGQIGEIITVENINSGQQFSALVLSSKRVEVEI